MRGKREQFDHQQLEVRRERLANLVLMISLAWFAVLFAIGLASDWFEPFKWLKTATVWGTTTVDKLLAIGGWLFVAIGVGGRWTIRNMLRPPQVFIVLRDIPFVRADEPSLQDP